MGTAIKHPVPDWVKPSFVIFVIRTLTLRMPGCQKITNDGLTRYVYTVGVKELITREGNCEY